MSVGGPSMCVALILSDSQTTAMSGWRNSIVHRIGDAPSHCIVEPAEILTLGPDLGPRILRSFMRDRANQVVLGTFVATYLYGLVVLRAIRGGDDAFVPELSFTVGFGLTIVSVFVLVFFMHHAASAIRASTIIAAVGRDLDVAVDRLFPASAGQEPPGEPSNPDIPEDRAEVLAHETGYVQTVDESALMDAAEDLDVVIRLLVSPGDFVTVGRQIKNLGDACSSLRSGTGHASRCVVGNVPPHRPRCSNALPILQRIRRVAGGQCRVAVP